MRRGALTAPRIAKLILLALLAAGVAWLAVRTYLPRANPSFAWVAAEEPSAVFRETGRELVANRGRLDEDDYQRLSDAIRREPLASDPFLFFGIKALSDEDLAAAERLLTESRDRNPRNRLARLALMGLYLRTGRVTEGSNEIAALVRIMPRAAEVLVPELARLAASPQTRAAVVQAIGDEPILELVLDRMTEQGVDPDVVLALGARQPRAADGRFPSWQNRLLARLVEEGEVDRAYDLWRRFVGAERAGPVYDAEFKGLPGPPPFNWELTESDVGAAELARGGGLELEYFGRKSGPLARQLLLLRPGRYRLQFQAEGSASGQGARILIQMACRGGETLAQVPLQRLNFTPRPMALDVTVPGGCEAQWLTFTGQAAEFPNTQRARVTGLSLRPVG